MCTTRSSETLLGRTVGKRISRTRRIVSGRSRATRRATSAVHAASTTKRISVRVESLRHAAILVDGQRACGKSSVSRIRSATSSNTSASITSSGASYSSATAATMRGDGTSPVGELPDAGTDLVGGEVRAGVDVEQHERASARLGQHRLLADQDAVAVHSFAPELNEIGRGRINPGCRCECKRAVGGARPGQQ